MDEREKADKVHFNPLSLIDPDLFPDHETAMLQTWAGVRELDQKVDAITQQLAAQAQELETIREDVRGIGSQMFLHGHSLGAMIGALLVKNGIDPLTLGDLD
jgi:uncharacterized protein YhaN